MALKKKEFEKQLQHFTINFRPQHLAVHGVLRLILELNRVVIVYDNSAVEPYANIGAWINSKMSERNPPLYCTITSIAMQGHQTKQRQKTR